MYKVWCLAWRVGDITAISRGYFEIHKKSTMDRDDDDLRTTKTKNTIIRIIRILLIIVVTDEICFSFSRHTTRNIYFAGYNRCARATERYTLYNLFGPTETMTKTKYIRAYSRGTPRVTFRRVFCLIRYRRKYTLVLKPACLISTIYMVSGYNSPGPRNCSQRILSVNYLKPRGSGKTENDFFRRIVAYDNIIIQYICTLHVTYFYYLYSYILLDIIRIYY